MAEEKYKTIIDNYLKQDGNVKEFCENFFEQFYSDRDNKMLESYNPVFERIISIMFTTCDCYSENPENEFEISEVDLKYQVGQLAYIWWGSY